MEQTIIIVEDHPIVRRGYASIIERIEGCRVVGETGNAQDALELISALKPDLAIVDLTLEGSSGLELIKQLRALMRNLPILVVSVHDEQLYAERALSAGARGFIMKDETTEALADAIETVLRGGAYVSPRMNRQLVLKSLGRTVPAGTPLDTLSDRELEVFEHIGRGHTTRETAEAMFVSPRTVDTHRRQARKKLDISSDEILQLQAVLWVHQNRH